MAKTDIKKEDGEMNWVFGYCDSGNPHDIRVAGNVSDMDTMDDSYDYAERWDFVSGTYNYMSKEELIECIIRDGWWFVKGAETEDDGFPVEDYYRASTKKSNTKGVRMNGKMKKTLDNVVWNKMDALKEALGCDELVENMVRAMDTDEANGIFDYIGRCFEVRFDENGNEVFEDYEASTKKSKYSDIHKRLNKIGGFTKEDDDSDDDKVEVEVEVEDDDSDDESEIEESCKGCKSKKKVSKGENMPSDADDFKEDNQKGSGNAGSTLPEDADDQQDQNEAGSGNAGSELPEDADDQQDIKESTRKARMERMSRARNKGVNKNLPVKKFSVTAGGSPDQTSYIQRYNQNPMVRQAIDGHFGSKSEKSFDEVGMLQDRLDALNKSKRNENHNNVPQKLR